MLTHPTMRCACCGSTDIVYITTWDSATTYVAESPWVRERRQWEEMLGKLNFPTFDLDRGPQYGWYQLFQPWPRLTERVANVSQAPRHRRAQARACRIDQRRWKRRRFLHSLRRAAS